MFFHNCENTETAKRSRGVCRSDDEIWDIDTRKVFLPGRAELFWYFYVYGQALREERTNFGRKTEENKAVFP